MKMNIEDYLHKIDTAFQGKEPKEKYMIYLMVVAGIFAFSYFLFWDSSFQSFEHTRKSVKKLEKRIAADQQYIKRTPKIKITQLERDIKQINKQMIVTRDNNDYIKHKIEAISSLIYDEQAWGAYLNSITANAQKYHVKIKNITNKYAKSENAFGHILDIKVSSEGNFKDTVKFVNSMEQSDLVVDIHDFSIKAENSLNSDFNISVWGIKY